MNEIWKPIIGFEKFYEISNFGRVKRVVGGPGARANKIMKERKDKSGYRYACLCKNGIQTYHMIHALELEAFGHQKPTPKHEVNHKDGIKFNNELSNLEWVTEQETFVGKIQVCELIDYMK